METEPISILQLPLFAYGESVTNIVELFPAVWKATESLTSPDMSIRSEGINSLVEVGAEKVSPLVAYMIATRLTDPDLDIRKKVVYILGDVLEKKPSEHQIPNNVRRVVTHYLHNMREEAITGLLEVSAIDPNAETSIYHVLNACPDGGKYLSEIVSQWKNPLTIRQKAIYFIGLVGYMESKPVLERLFNRLEARQGGQFTMDFVSPSSKTDDDLLPTLRVALHQLNAR
jgi:hypothetical protein